MFNNAFLFPGQGSQYIGMGKSFYDNSSLARKRFEQANKALGFNFTKLCFKGPYNKLSLAENIQPAVLLISLIAFELWMEKIKIPPKILIGHSFGELSALTCAGVIAFEDSLKIASIKGKIATDLVKNKKVAMSVIKNINIDELKEMCDKVSNEDQFVSIGVINSKNQISVTGYEESVDEIQKIVKKKGGQYQKINTNAPFHSIILKKGVNKLKKELNKIEINSFRYPVFSSTRLKLYKDNKDIVDIISNSYIEIVDWFQVMDYLKTEKINTTIEIGPQKILSNIISEDYQNFKTYNFNKYDDIDYFIDNFNLSYGDKYNIISRCLKIAICLKNSNANEREYKEKVSKTYYKVFEKFIEKKNSRVGFSFGQVLEAINMLDSVMKIKKINSSEVNERWQEVFRNINKI